MPVIIVLTLTTKLVHVQVFSVLLSAPLLGNAYPPLAVWASLLPIIGGCAMSSLNEVTFSWPGFLNASASNVGMVLRNIVRSAPCSPRTV